jgi:hypothetical protein
MPSDIANTNQVYWMLEYCLKEISQLEIRILGVVLILYFGFLFIMIASTKRQVKMRKELNLMKEQIELLTKVCMSNHQNQDPLGEQTINTEKN